MTRRGRAPTESELSVDTPPAVTRAVNACFADAMGPGGVPRAAFEKLLPEAAHALDRLRQARASGAYRFLAYADARGDLETGP